MSPIGEAAKSFDTEGNVLWCGSVSKTLAPGYRVGWIAPGRYDHHLRHFRKMLQENYQRYALAISMYFPEGTKISRPQGGLALWVAFPKHIDTAELYNYALKKQISIAPGRMFTLQNQFQNCMRLCIGLPWTEDLG